MKTSTLRVLPALMFLYLTAVVQTIQAVNPPPDGCYPGLTTAEGCSALFSLATGQGNTATGADALFSDTSGSWNTAVGAVALGFNNADFNTAVGVAALLLNDTGGNNTAMGAAALLSNNSGSENTAVGALALFNNTTIGFKSGDFNTATGVSALYGNITGGFNTAIGHSALGFSTGNFNIALGANAGASLMTGDNNIYVGSAGAGDESDSIRIGNPVVHTATYIAGISGAMVTGTAVVVNASGQLGVAASAQHFKDEIKPMNKASEAILALEPVTFRYKKEFDPNRVPQFGLVAEQVEKVNPDLVARDPDGKPYTVRYEAVNAMLLNEFLKEHHAFIEEQRKVQRLEAALHAVNQRLKEQEAQIEKVSAQIEMGRCAPQVVSNNP